MMENKKITHIDWNAIEDKYGNRPLTKAETRCVINDAEDLYNKLK